jgi:predicted phosphate transport protein (TIGR00153 family)
VRLPGVPRERRFYELFNQQSDHIVAAAHLLIRQLEAGGDAADLRRQIKDCEHRGDDVTHEIVNSLNRTFVTPFDREDIYALSSGLDDVLDYIDEVADTVIVYRITSIPDAARRMAVLIRDAVLQLQEAIRRLAAPSDLAAYWIEVHRLENEGDRVSRDAIGHLFANGTDAVELVKLKDFYTLLEDGLDRCEDVANVIESIVIKNA